MSDTSGLAAARPRSRPYGGLVGDSASNEAVGRLQRELGSLKSAHAALSYLKQALEHIRSRDYAQARVAAQKVVDHNPTLVHGWHLLAIAREHLGDWPAALEAYERGLALDPTNPPITNDLGRLASKMEMYPQAEALFRHYLSFRPFSAESSNNLANVLREQLRYDEAIEVLKPAIQAHPDRVMLWNALGVVLEERGEIEQANIFYGEAVRLNPNEGKTRYNLANTLFALGQREEAIAECRRAIADSETPEDLTTMRFALGTMLLAVGSLAEGWDAYVARLDPTYRDPIHFVANRPRWEPGADIAGRHLLLFGEQGLGDEILFANPLDDVLAALGPNGRLTLAVTDRLASLFERSFPTAKIGPHLTIKHLGKNLRSAPFVENWEDVDLWAPLGEATRQFRRSTDAFPERPDGFFSPDPERVRHWRQALAALPGVRVGLLWTSMLIDTARYRHFAPFEAWEPVLRTPGVSFVNLQYGDQSEAIARARRDYGVEIVQMPDIDLKNDLDDVAALACALDLTIGFSNASFNLAAACGAPSWLLTSADAWSRLGSNRYPWYSQVRTFWPSTPSDWSALMGQLSGALTDHVKRTTPLVRAEA